MRILHISDLHRTSPVETLKAIWGGPQNAIRKLPVSEQKFDFIVVSGDLAARAQPHEYDELYEFTVDVLMPFLRLPTSRKRVIFVPGNHDVDWGADLGESMQIAMLLESPGGAEILERYLQSYRHDPARSGIRQIISKYGHIEWLKLDEARHGNRFHHVHRFLQNFYEEGEEKPEKQFDLLSPQEGRDWSAHVFASEQVAFYGFNSCFLNDRYWTGAAISRESIANAASHADEHASQCVRVAVWHHGLHSDSYRPDYLNQADIGQLIVSGFQVGFHGHTHKAAASQLGWVGDRFVLVSTGSLGANQGDRPDAVGKQFSIVHLYPHQAHVQVYERSGDVSVYSAKPVRAFSLGHYHEHSEREITAGSHCRHYHLDRHGISTVMITVNHLRTPHPIQIAEIGPPVCNARGAGMVSSSPGFEIRQTREQDTIRFTLYPPDDRVTNLEWSYQASNFVPMTQTELPHYNAQHHQNKVVRTHTVHFPCKSLELVFSFDDPLVDLESVAVWVEKSVEHMQERHWERVENEIRRCELHKNSATELSVYVEAPIVGYRYGLAYQPLELGYPLDFKAGRIAAKLIDRCLEDREHGPIFALQLAESITSALSAVFNMPADDVVWSGFLWSEQYGQLFTTFGNFANRQWICHYPCGAGVAGHAFRFNRPAAWSRSASQNKDVLVYQPNPPQQYGTWDHDWIVCIPLVGDIHKNPLGVIQFEGGGKEIGFGDRLREFANAALANEATKGSSWERFQQELSTAVNTGFWQACVVVECLLDYRDYISKLVRTLRLGGLPNDELLLDEVVVAK